MTKTKIQYVSDTEGKNVGVIVPIDLWHKIQGELETAFLLKSRKMKSRLMRALHDPKVLSFEEVREKLPDWAASGGMP
jgi:hypothetical protein